MQEGEGEEKTASLRQRFFNHSIKYVLSDSP